MSEPLPKPGWYPNGPGLERWWDGRTWGHQVRAIPTMPARAVTKQPRHTSHTFHLLMSLLTCGLWIPVWILAAIVNNLSREKIVTRYR